jgi:hypothetical protein
LLIRSDKSWEQVRLADAEVVHCSEHFVEFDEQANRWSKVTIPPHFGLTPALVSTPSANLRADPSAPSFKTQIEFVPATPLEYLDRCLNANDVFGDDVQLASIIEWPDSSISLGTTQPHYSGTPASHRQIEDYFVLNHWRHLPDASGHLLFFNYAFGVLAIDAVPRNCYILGQQLQPFDVILCRPDDAMQDFLGIYA